MGDHLSRWIPRRRGGVLVGALLAAAIVLAGPASASAGTLYVAVGDSVGAGFGATAGQSYFDLYCAYLESAAGGSLVDQCVNESVSGLTSQSALDGGTIQKVVNDIQGSSNTPVVTVILGGNDLIGSPGCQPITGASCNFIHNMRTILDQLETALASHPGPHLIQWLEYYNANHDNPFGSASADQSTAALLLGNDFAVTDCSSYDLSLIGLNDAINCIAREKGATPVDAYAPFQSACTSNDCFSDALHPDDKGYGLIFDAFRDTPGTPVPTTPPPDGSWPFPTAPQDTVPPAVTGVPSPGSALGCSVGTWSGSPPPTFKLQWLRDSAAIAGETTSTYVVQSTDTSHAISCQVTASNAAGSASRTSNALVVTAPLALPALAQIFALTETRNVFRPSSPHHSGGTIFSFRLDQPAEVTIAIQGKAPGRRVGQSCEYPFHRLGHHPACTRTIPITKLTKQGHAGLNRIPFDGRVRGRVLKPARYLATFEAIDQAGESPAQTLHFTILRLAHR